MINRYIEKKVLKYLNPGKVVTLLGPRQVGKTTLLHQIKSKIQEKILFLSGEDLLVKDWLSSQSIQSLKENIGDYEYLFIDEAQAVKEIGISLKLMVDHIPNLKILATGSSSFELDNKLGEPLIGRQWTFTLYPIAQMELNSHENRMESKARLSTRLIYGSYPEVITETSIEKKRSLLQSIVNGYLLKDLLEFEGIRKSSKLIDLLRLLAYQIGHDVSFTELAKSIENELENC